MAVPVFFDYAGDTDQARLRLRRAVEVRDPNAPYLPVEPFTSNLGNDPRFQALVKQMKPPLSWEAEGRSARGTVLPHRE